MSFNLNSICAGLESSKVRERNDSVNLLAEFTSSTKIPGSSKQLSQLISLTFKLIEHEKSLYLKAPLASNNAIQSRITRATNSIARIIESAFKRPNGKPTLTYKHLVKILRDIAAILSTSTDIFWPAAFDFVRAANMITAQTFVKDHLNTQDWLLVYKLFVLCVRCCQESNQDHSTNLILLIELFGGIGNLILANDSVSTLYLHLVSSFKNVGTLPLSGSSLAISKVGMESVVARSEKAYFLLLPVLKRAVDDMSREGALTVTLLKIINKLAIVLSNEDTYFVNKLVILGISVLTSFSNSKLITLQTQMVIFLNLESVHSYLLISTLPRMNEDVSSSKANVSIRSDSESEEREEDVLALFDGESNSCEKDEDILVLAYKTGVLVQSLFHLTTQQRYQLSSNNVGFHNQTTQQTWFILKSVYLYQENKQTTEGFEIPWLLYGGLARFIVTYFKMKRHVTLVSNSETPEPYAKRQKLDTIQQSLQESTDILEFLCRLLNSNANHETQRGALQLLVFHLQQQETSPNKLLSFPREDSSGNCSSSATSDESNSSLIDFETTILNGAFEVNDFRPLVATSASSAITARTACKEESTKLSKSRLLKHILRCFDNPNLIYWAILACSSIIEDTSVLRGLLSSKQNLQLFKLVLPVINNASIANLASYFVFKLISSLEGSLSQLVDPTVVILFDNLIEVSDVNGPSYISRNSLFFWYAISKVIKETNLTRKADVQLRIQAWWIAKFEKSSSPERDIDLIGISFYSKFIIWLCGINTSREQQFEVEESAFRYVFESTLNEVHYLMKKYSVLQQFIVDKEILVESSGNNSNLGIPPLGNISERKLEDLLSVMFSQLLLSNKKSEKLQWILLFQNIFINIEDIVHFKNCSSSINSHILRLIGSISFDSISRSDVLDCFTTLSMTSMKLIFHTFEKYKNTFMKLDISLIVSILTNVSTSSIANQISGGFNDDFQNSALELDDTDHRDVGRLKIPSLYWLDYGMCSNSFLFLIKLFMSLSDIIPLEDSMKLCLFVLSKIETDDTTVLLASMIIVKSLETKDFDLKIVRDFLMYLGLGPLSSPILERNELTVVVVSRLLSILSPKLKTQFDTELNNSWVDMANWLLQCGQKRLIQSEFAFIEYSRFLVTAMEIDRKYELEFLDNFHRSTNNVKTHIAKSLKKTFSESKSFHRETELYKGIFSRFEYPQQAVENSAAFCLFFSSLCGLYDGNLVSTSILVSIVFNLVELTRFHFIVPYISAAIRQICSNFCGKITTRELFGLLKFDLLKYWWIYNSEFTTFPFVIFGFENFETPMNLFYKEMVAISFSIQLSNRSSNIDKFLGYISHLKRIDEASIIIDSFPLIIPLAYSESGVKNDIHQKLKKTLKDSYSDQFKLRLPIIVLETIKFMDLSQECNPGLETPLISLGVTSTALDLLESPGVCISIATGMDLLNSIIGKYLKGASFWDDQKIQYFLIRRLSLSLTGKNSLNSKLLCMRRIKMVLNLGMNNSGSIQFYNLIKVIVDTLCPILRESKLEKLQKEIVLVLSCVSFVDLSPSQSIPLVVKILSSFSATELHLNEKAFINIEATIRLLDSYAYGNCARVLQLCISKILNLPGILAIRKKDIELLLARRDEFDICNINGSYDDIFTIISYIFPDEKFTQETFPDKKIVESLEKMNREQFQYVSESFADWYGKYLADYYLTLGPLDSGQISLPSSHNQEAHPKILDKLFEYVLELRNESIEVNASVESIVGVLIWKFEANKAEVLKYINFVSHYSDFENHILPIDFHSCILLHSYEVEMTVPVISLQEFLERTDERISFENWTSKIFIALTTEISRFTSITPLFSPLALMIPTFASSVLPNLISAFVQLTGENASIKVAKILLLFSERRLGDIDYRFCDLYIQILLDIRTKCKQKLPYFEGIYSNIDLISFFRMSVNTGNSSTSLLIFEDAANLATSSLEILQSETKHLQKIYESINDDDLVFGLPIEPSMDYAMSVMNRGTSNLDQVKFNSSIFDASLSLSQMGDMHTQKLSLIHSMIANGMVGVSSLLRVGNEDGGINDDDFEWAWKLNVWDIPISSSRLSEELNEHKVLYETLKRVHDFPTRAEAICKASMLEILSNVDSDRPKWLKSLACVSSIREIVCREYDKPSKFSKKTQWIEVANDLEVTENMLLSRKSILQILVESESINRESVHDNWIACIYELVRFNSISRSKFSQKSLNSTMLLSEIADTKFGTASQELKKFVKNVAKFQSACTLWELGETSIPVAMLKELKNGIETEDQSIPTISLSATSRDIMQVMTVTPAIVNAYLVQWMSESRQELPSTLMNQFVEPTIDMLNRSGVYGEQSTKIYSIFAHFCEKQLTSYTLQGKIHKVGSLIKSKRIEIDELKAHYNRKAVNPSEKVTIQRYYLKLKTQYSQDVQELETLESTKSELSDKAIEFYLKSIKHATSNLVSSSDIDENIDKFFALWLEYSSKEDINKKIKQDLLSLPMHMLIGWCPQLISRISNDATEFQYSLQLLILKLCELHPYHSLYNLISLAKHESSSKLNPSSTIAAVQMLQKLKSNSINQPILNDIEKFCDEAIKLAEVKVAARGKSLHLDKNMLSRSSSRSGGEGDYSWWINDLPPIPPPTIDLKIDLTLTYKDCPKFEKIDPKIDIATSGLSLPKIATFVLSDGTLHKMLLKHGADDLRQDSIMEQVFERVNQMFSRDKQTRKRCLRIRTYKAIPLGPQNGVIEFVPNSKALIDVIKPYHQTMDKMKVEVAREKMKKCQTGSKTTRLAVYEDITLSKILPVLRHFFFDTFTSPESWIQSRILYTHGLATTSIVGHILGLGDRHCNNILLDKETGEPIHIDLGVAFDQGKRLPIPETVPFRLTRDMVDGLGVTGVEGSFRKSCEHSFKVLRQNKDHVIAILDVLRWDPLYSWTLSPLRRNKLQDEDEDEGGGISKAVAPAQSHEDGSEAGRAINNVADKLVGGGLSVEATVRELIQEATSSDNLAVIYCGWCPFF